MPKRIYENSWKYRRSAVFTTLIGCAAGMAYCLLQGVDNALYRDAFTTLALLFGTTLQGYMGWVVADDRFVTNKLGKEAFRKEEVPDGWPDDVAPPEKMEGQS